MANHSRTDTERLAIIEEIVARIEHRLFGNGQPGEVQSIKNRLLSVERWQWKAAGALSILTLAIHIIMWVFKK